VPLPPLPHVWAGRLPRWDEVRPGCAEASAVPEGRRVGAGGGPGKQVGRHGYGGLIAKPGFCPFSSETGVLCCHQLPKQRNRRRKVIIVLTG